MKKLVFLLLFVLIGCQKTPIYKIRAFNDPWNPVNVGQNPNDHTGYTLRNAMIQLNTTDAATLDSLLNKDTKEQSVERITYSYDTTLLAALNMFDYTYNKADSGKYKNPPTWNQMVNYVESHSGGGAGGFDGYKFIVGTTAGAPGNGDTTSLSKFASLAGMHIEVYRGTTGDLHLQNYNTTATNTINGYRYDANATVVVKPAWATGDRAIIKGYPSGSVNWLTLSGSSDTITNHLRAGWRLDETTGTSVSDILGVYNGTTTGTVNQTGKFGKAELFTRASTQWADFGTTVGDVGLNDFSIVGWVYGSTVSSENMGITGNCSDAPYFYLKVATEDNKVHGVVNFGSGNLDTESNSALSATTWTHVVYTCDRSGNAHLYINSVDQTDVTDISSGVAVSLVNDNHFGIGAIGDYVTSYTWNGMIDDVYFYIKHVLSQAEINRIYAATHPF